MAGTQSHGNIFGPIVPHASRLGKVAEPDIIDIGTYIGSLPATGLLSYIDALYAKLQLSDTNNMLPKDVIDNISPVLGFSFERRFHQEDTELFLQYNMEELLQLQKSMVRLHLHEPDADARHFGAETAKKKLRLITAAMHTFNRLVLVTFRLQSCMEEVESGTGYDTSGIGASVGEPGVSFIMDDSIKRKDYHELLLHLLHKASEKGYRKYGDLLYERIVIKEGDTDLKTHAWRMVMRLEEFVVRSCPKETDMQMWCNMTARGCTVAEAARYLAKCVDPELPSLRKDRHTFAFTNGTYVAWYEHEDGTVTDRFVPYKREPGQQPLGSHVIAANYFEHPMEYAGKAPWQDIPTPNLDKILDLQKFEPEVRRWLYIFIGRLMHDLNEHDGWQIIPFLKGVGGSGKSTLVNEVCGNIYEAQDVGILSNNCERRFGLSALVDKLLFLAPEIKHDLQLEQAEFQSIVSGEQIQINKKHETAFSAKWTTPGILAGNEMPGWIDNSGSIGRRVLIFHFCHQVPANKGDMELNKKLKAEMGNILQKCTRAYIEAVVHVGADNVWNHLPPYFRDQQHQLMIATNSAFHFLDSGVCRFGKDLYVPQSIFKDAYQRHCKDNGLAMRDIRSDAMLMALAYYNISVSHMAESKPYPPHSRNQDTKTEKYLLGIDMIDNDTLFDLANGNHGL
jgi:hypothetical protein